MGSNASSWLFDFEAFLGDVDVRKDIFGPYLADSDDVSGEDCKIEKLNGGYINVTVRATFIDGRGGNLGLAKKSIVMKYAPPFIATVGEGAPFGTFRQVIESRALALLANTPAIIRSQLHTGVRIPKLIRFDEVRHVLVLEDLGDGLITLNEWLCPTVSQLANGAHTPDAQMCQITGTRLGKILATIHSDEVLYRQLASGEFFNPEAIDLIAVEVVGKVKDILGQYLPQEEKVDHLENEAEKISRIIRHEFRNPDLKGSDDVSRRVMFSVGDLWTGSILMGPALTHQVEMGLIDWEFAGEGRALQDMGQLGAWLHLLAQAASWSSERPDWKVTHSSHSMKGSSPCVFARSLFGAYALQLQASLAYPWISNPRSPEEEAVRLRAIRSTWILHGRELIVDSVEALDKFEGLLDGDVEGWQTVMVEIGCWYVRLAGESDDIGFKEAVEKEEFLRPLYSLDFVID